MPNKTLLWIIPSYEKKMQINEVDLDKLNELANQYEYDVKFVFLLDKKIEKDKQTEIDETVYNFNQSIEYTVKVYDKKIYPNTSIMKELENAEFDYVMITNLKYTNKYDILDEMLEKSTIPNTNFVHLHKKRLGFYGELTNLTKALYNKIVRMFTNSHDNMYVRNCVIFDKVVLDLIKDFPNSSGVIRETSYLAGTQTEIVTVDNSFKNAKLKFSTIGLFITSSIICLIALALFIIICAVPMNLDTLLWVIIADIITSVLGIIFINYSVLQEKIKINNFNLETTTAIQPIFENTYNASFDDTQTYEILETNNENLSENENLQNDEVVEDYNKEDADENFENVNLISENGNNDIDSISQTGNDNIETAVKTTKESKKKTTTKVAGSKKKSTTKDKSETKQTAKKSSTKKASTTKKTKTSGEKTEKSDSEAKSKTQKTKTKKA